MNQEKRSSWGNVIGLLVCGLLVVGFAAVTSETFQENVLHAEPSEEVVSKATESSEGSADEDLVKVAEETSSEPAGESPAEDLAAAGDNECCHVGDETPPIELVKQVPPGGLHNPYDWKKLVADSPEDYLVKQFRLPGCNECHGGGGGGGMCPALSQGVWFWGNTDDVLFRLIAIGSKDLEAAGFARIRWGTVKAPMPPMGQVIKTSDHMWKIVSFIRSINPVGTNPPEKVVPGRYTPPGETKAE
jgi:hypothetical protein